MLAQAQACFFEKGGRDGNGYEKNAERETGPETRVVRGCEWVEVVIGGREFASILTIFEPSTTIRVAGRTRPSNSVR